MLQRLRAVRQNARQNEGFTLVELLIVIVILGILAGIVVFAVNGITDRGIKSACKTDAQTVQVASEAYYAQNSAWAASIAHQTGGVYDTDSLVGAGLLQKAPSSDKYTIVLNANGSVTATINGGGDCLA